MMASWVGRATAMICCCMGSTHSTQYDHRHALALDKIGDQNEPETANKQDTLMLVPTSLLI
jgi:hypothetical protein